MKDPIQEYEKQGQKLDEIFGWLSRTFGSGSSTTPSSFLDAMKRYQDTDTDADCAKMDVGKKINRKVGGSAGSASLAIGENKIGNIKGLRFELLNDKGKGTGKFDNAIVNDFKCYDLDRDIYGIKWLFDDSASYEAESISGDLKAGVKNQTLNFKGKWNGGRFYGRFFSSPEDFKGIAGPSATFAFFDYGKKGSAPVAKRKTTKKKTGKKLPAAPTIPPASTTTPPTVGTTPPPAPAAATPPPAPAAPAPTPTAPATAGKKGKKGKLTESKTAKPIITMRGFLDSFM